MNPWQLPAASDHFSEFTYGFALVNELVSNKPRTVNVPVFPSLIMEGQTGGGYDVYLDRPGRPMFLQFKLARAHQRPPSQGIPTTHIPKTVLPHVHPLQGGLTTTRAPTGTRKADQNRSVLLRSPIPHPRTTQHVLQRTTGRPTKQIRAPIRASTHPG